MQLMSLASSKAKLPALYQAILYKELRGLSTLSHFLMCLSFLTASSQCLQGDEVFLPQHDSDLLHIHVRLFLHWLSFYILPAESCYRRRQWLLCSCRL